MHVIVPADALAADPMKGAVAQVPLREAAKAGAGGPPLPEGIERFVVSVDGTESEAELASLQVACSGFTSTFPGSWNSRMCSDIFTIALKLSWPCCRWRAEASALPCCQGSFYIALCCSCAFGVAPMMTSFHDGPRSFVVLWHVSCSTVCSGRAAADPCCHVRALPALCCATLNRCGGQQGSAAAMVLLDVAPGVSRIHASRRVFELLGRHDVDLPVIHRRAFPAGPCLPAPPAPIPFATFTAAHPGAREPVSLHQAVLAGKVPRVTVPALRCRALRDSLVPASTRVGWRATMPSFCKEGFGCGHAALAIMSHLAAAPVPPCRDRQGLACTCRHEP